MGSQSKGNFIRISPDTIMQDGSSSVAVFNISGINEEDTTEYYPIMSNFYDTAIWYVTGTPIKDINDNTVPPKALQYRTVNKIIYNGTIYWLSNIGIDSLKYRAIENSAKYITISTADDWNTYTVAFVSDDVG